MNLWSQLILIIVGAIIVGVKDLPCVPRVKIQCKASATLSMVKLEMRLRNEDPKMLA